MSKNSNILKNLINQIEQLAKDVNDLKLLAQQIKELNTTIEAVSEVVALFYGERFAAKNKSNTLGLVNIEN